MTTSSKLYSLTSATMACLLWGIWSYYINSRDGFTAGLISGLTQGAISFFMTLAVVVIVNKTYNSIRSELWRRILPAILAVSLLSTILILGHYLVGTPYIGRTIAPILIVTFIFCLFTTRRLASKDAGMIQQN